jgi:hypothetical protein
VKALVSLIENVQQQNAAVQASAEPVGAGENR